MTELFVKNIVWFSAAIGAAIVLGGILPALRHYHKHQFTALLSFSAGIMLGSSFIHLIPSSIEMIGVNASYGVLAGFLFLFLTEKFVTVHICEAFDCEVHQIGISAFLGLTLHALIDGFAMGAALLTQNLGLIVFAAVFAHKTPEAFSLTSILLHSEFKRAHVFFANFVLWLMFPVGAFLAAWMIGKFSFINLGMALAFCAGTFLEICLTDLIPEVHRLSHSKIKSFVGFLLGLVAMGLLHMVVGDH